MFPSWVYGEEVKTEVKAEPDREEDKLEKKPPAASAGRRPSASTAPPPSLPRLSSRAQSVTDPAQTESEQFQQAEQKGQKEAAPAEGEEEEVFNKAEMLVNLTQEAL